MLLKHYEQAALFAGFWNPDPANTANRVSAEPANNANRVSVDPENTYVEEYVPDPYWGICSLRTMSLIALMSTFSEL